MTFERLSLSDASILSSFAEHIQRYEFALEFSRGKRVLDAGCGTGYGSHFLAANGAQSVLGFDISDEALLEAKTNYRLGNLRFARRDVEALADDPLLKEKFDVVVNYENLEHLQRPERLISGVTAVLVKGGKLVTSTPNGAIAETNREGKPANRFHVREFAACELEALLSAHFESVQMHGQWLTHCGRLRKRRAQELFEQLCESYYNPMSRLGRLVKRAIGKKVAGPPLYTANADSFVGDHEIRALEPPCFTWEPSVLIAVCTKHYEK